MTSRNILWEHAGRYGWHRTTNWHNYPLQDRYVKGGATITVKFDITGRCIAGVLDVGRDHRWINNRNAVMDALEKPQT